MSNKTTNIPLKYIPNRLSESDKKQQLKEIQKSRRLYKKTGKIYTRKKVKSYKSRPSNHVANAKRIYKIDSIKPSAVLAAKTGCSIEALEKIVAKGAAAYGSGGSRPNQTPESWGIARLASAITGGKSAAVDYSILEAGCIGDKRKSKALRLAAAARKKHGYGTRKVPKFKL